MTKERLGYILPSMERPSSGEGQAEVASALTTMSVDQIPHMAKAGELTGIRVAVLTRDHRYYPSSSEPGSQDDGLGPVGFGGYLSETERLVRISEATPGGADFGRFWAEFDRIKNTPAVDNS